MSTLAEERGAMDYIDFSSVDPNNFAVSCPVCDQVYNPLTKLAVQNISSFEKNAYDATSRKGDQLLAVGEENGYVWLFECSSENPLRIFRSHMAGVHRVPLTADNMRLESFLKDRTVKLWDIAEEKVIHTYDQEHSDYIRAGCAVSPNIFITGSYDETVKVFDIRMSGSNEKGGVIFQVNRGLLTESPMWLIGNGARFMSGSLDRHNKDNDIENYQPVYSFDSPNAVLSMGVCTNDGALVAGMVNDLTSIQRMDNDTPKIQQKYEYMAALSSVLLPFVVNILFTFSVALRALARRTHNSLSRIIEFSKDSLHMHGALELIWTVTDVFERGSSNIVPINVQQHAKVRSHILHTHWNQLKSNSSSMFIEFLYQ